MTTIILDLEMNITKEKEIIEIAAVKLNERNEIISEFSSYVKPVWCEITKGTTKITGITQNDVQKAEVLEEVLEKFLEWIGEDYSQIYSWSMTDFEQLNEECKKKNIERDSLAVAFEKWADYQREFGDLICYDGQLSLKNAIAAIDYEFSGNQHSALDDARNTAVLFDVANDEAKKAKLNSIKEWFMPKEAMTITIGDLFPKLLCGLA